MRVSFRSGALAATALLTLVGCSSPNVHPFWHKFAFKSKSTAESGTALSNAPAAPSVGSTAAVAPTVTMPGPGSPNLSVYPGTNYPVTAYPPVAAPMATATNMPAYPPGGGAAPGHGANPQSMAPYAAPKGGSYVPGVADNRYAPQAGQSYAAPQGPPVAQPYDPFVAGNQGAPQYAPQNPPYAPAAPPGEAYNAAGPSGTMTR